MAASARVKRNIPRRAFGETDLRSIVLQFRRAIADGIAVDWVVDKIVGQIRESLSVGSGFFSIYRLHPETAE